MKEILSESKIARSNTAVIDPRDRVENYTDFKGIILTLWKEKWLIVMITSVFTIFAMIYAFTAQEWWSAKAKVVLPQVQDFSNYELQVKNYQPIFDTYQEDGTVLIDDQLNDLVDREELFQMFIRAFNSNFNKKSFLNKNELFQDHKIKIDGSDISEDSLRRVYSGWYKKISATPVYKNDKSEFILSLQSTSKEIALKMLSDYVLFVNEIVHSDALNNLDSKIFSKKNELSQQLFALEKQAKLKIEVEIKRAQFSHEIALAAGVDKPIQNIRGEDIFVIGLGSDALGAKIIALKEMKNLSVIEPRLQQLGAKLDLIQSSKLNRDIKFLTYRFLEEPSQPISRDKPNRLVIIILGLILGSGLSFLIVMMKHILRSNEQ
ncbi:Wzz/FepE/Etk N-terminal domain-containing protein [Vibrio sp. VB16]|uniref:Wzz/FepE/Etk N-terminal domain-containing protein n=1 Tax=Vibrio sp. VB16 TaxID=2785746 RepID=UPI00189F19EA|nr:Wzz/FepE/Etk N-terminal domain-containing protein [Vibrio sp. VB16]UGA54979.1 Wzz/FepE/Etk N-terminal domain-containing protein [Vibrio sp. VB16]